MKKIAREVMMLAAYHIEREAEAMEDSIEYERAMILVTELRRAAGVTDPPAGRAGQAEPGLPTVITPVGPYVYWYDPGQYAPPPLDSVEVIWSACGLDPVRDTAYRRFDGLWVLDSIDHDMVIQPLAWTPRPQMPRDIRGVES